MSARYLHFAVFARVAEELESGLLPGLGSADAEREAGSRNLARQCGRSFRPPGVRGEESGQ